MRQTGRTRGKMGEGAREEGGIERKETRVERREL